MISQTTGSLVKIIKIRSRQQEELQVFTGVDWRKAFNRYLDGVWSQHKLYAEGVLIIGEVILCLSEQEYTIQNPTGLESFPRPTHYMRSQIHVVTGERDHLEIGLARFLRNNQIRMLVAEFGCSRMMLWKGDVRPELHFTLVDRTF